MGMSGTEGVSVGGDEGGAGEDGGGEDGQGGGGVDHCEERLGKGKRGKLQGN